MGYTKRKNKHNRTNRKPSSMKTEINHASNLDKTLNSKSITDDNLHPVNCDSGLRSANGVFCNNESLPNPDLDPDSDEELEELMLDKLDLVYNAAINKLVALGYSEDIALTAILKNGHCYGAMDALNNIMSNCVCYLNSINDDSGVCSIEDFETGFADLKSLKECSIIDLVTLLQQVRPDLSKGDCMWCLVKSNLHISEASKLLIPSMPDPGNENSVSSGNLENIDNNAVGMSPEQYQFHGGWGFANGGGSELRTNESFPCRSKSTLEREIEFSKRSDLTPSMKSMLKRNVAMVAANFRDKQVQTPLQASPRVEETPVVQYYDTLDSNDQEKINSLLNKFRDFDIDKEDLEFDVKDEKERMVLSLIRQIKDTEKQVEERKEWAHQKEMQADKRLINDLNELKILRAEREETQRMKNMKQTLEDSLLKKLTDMENALRTASGHVDRANAAVRRLENENAEIRAEVEAYKLSASELVSTCLEATKREKKYSKKLGAWEKQKTKLQEEINSEKKNITEIEQELMETEQAQKAAEEKLKQEVKAKEEALTQLEKARRTKEAVEAKNKRKLEALRSKAEIDIQRHKDDLQRLKEEVSRLKASQDSSSLSSEEEKIARQLHALRLMDESLGKKVHYDHRECVICNKAEVSIVFLPCAHQVMCSNCNDEFQKNGNATCPCCRVPIEERIHVFSG